MIVVNLDVMMAKRKIGLGELAEKIDAAMASMRLRRTYSAELFESATRLHHRAIRYRCVADAAGNIYQ